MSSNSLPPACEPLSPAEIDRLIGEVAKRHGFLLDRNDPVLVTVTLNELMLARVASRIDRAVDAARRELASAAVAQRDASKSEASRLITAAAAEYADEQLRLAADGAADRIRAVLTDQRSAEMTLADQQQVTRPARFVRWAVVFVYLAASVIALIAIVSAIAFGTPNSSDCGASKQQNDVQR